MYFRQNLLLKSPKSASQTKHKSPHNKHNRHILEIRGKTEDASCSHKNLAKHQ